MLKRNVSDPGFGSWCDDSSTEDDENHDNDDGEMGTIVVSMASLTTHEEEYSSFYFSYRATTDTHSYQQRLNAMYDDDQNGQHQDDDGDTEDDHGIRISQKRCHDEAVFLNNVRRRTLRFVEEPAVQTYERAPDECHTDLYYTCHQLQTMMDAYYQDGNNSNSSCCTNQQDEEPQSKEDGVRGLERDSAEKDW